MKKLVVIGNGMAGVACVEQLLKLAPNRYEITIFGAEPYPNYNRILLSSVLAGDMKIEDIFIKNWNWYKENGITLHAGHPVSSIDVKNRTVETETGIRAEYDELIIATGSLPFMLPIPGADKEGVIAFRDIRDCQTMLEASKKYRRAAVIGGGLLGLEAARGLLNLGMDVYVVHLFNTLMERQLDATAANMLRRELERQGMKFLLEKQSEQILGRRRATGIRFRDGSELEVDLIVMAVGIRPNVALAKAAGIAVNRGIVVDDYMQTSVPNVYAVGECAEHRGIVYGLVAPLYEQGAVLAKRLAGVETQGYQGSVTAAKLKVSGVQVFSAGVFNEEPGMDALRFQDDVAGIYKKLVFRDGRLIGAVLFGDTSDHAKLFALIRSEENVAGRERELLLGDAAAGGKTRTPEEIAQAMAPDEIVCGCNGVSKQTILDAIKQNGLTNVQEVKMCTKASGSCGGCRPLVEALLALSVGDRVTKVKEGICGCTTLDRDEVVRAIREMHLTNIREVMNVLGWKNPEGCSKCRPALNYYLGMLWPEEYEDDRASRFVNERNHANIQKDGTYSVVPRIYGGVTTPAELKKIAEVAEKYNVPLVKITGGQRIDLLGVKKEDLPSVWEELGMPSGYAYAKALRTVKTCVGSTFCRFGTQDSIAMGIAIEKKYERLETPHKVKLAVSGCPRNCAEATIKDFGVVAIEGGWELYVGGNGGTKVRAADLLCKVKTEEEVLEWCGAYLQYYRETAKWNERTSEWIQRVGLETVKKALADPADRKALLERLEKLLKPKKDPWREVVRNPELRREYEASPEPVEV